MESFVSAANYAIFPTNIFAVQFSRMEDGMGQAVGWWKYDSGKTQQFLFGSATYEPVALKFAYCFYYTLPRPRGAGSAFLCCILYGHGSRCSCLIVSLGHASPHLSLHFSCSLSRTLLLRSRSFNFLLAAVKTCTYTVTLANCPVCVSPCVC